jgi:hypothetical protein
MNPVVSWATVGVLLVVPQTTSLLSVRAVKGVFRDF